MHRTASLLLVFVALAVCGADWLQFRGTNGASASQDAAPPDSWDGETDFAWRANLPGKSVSSPIVVKGRVIVTSSSGVNQDRLHVLAYDVETGKQIWSRQFWATGRTLTHPFSAVAAPTPTSDGQRIFAFYSSNDLICLDLDGNLLWYRGLAFDFPKAGNDIGMSSSPVVADDTVMVQIESQGESFATGIDVATGETRWRVDRVRSPNWASPVVMPGKRGGRTSLILQSGSGLVGLDVRTGEQFWKFELACQTTPSLAVTEDRIYVPANGLTALDLPVNATTPAFAWNSSQLNPNPASPVVAGGRIYAMNSSGVLSCGDLKDGKRLWQLRIGGRHWSTPVVAGNRIFCVNADGKAKVVQLGESGGKVVGSNDFGEAIKSSPAVSDGALYVRSDRYLWKIAKK